MTSSCRGILLVAALLMLPGFAVAQVDPGAGLQAIVVQAGENGGQSYSVTLQALVLMTVLTMLPAFLLMTTAFTRVIIVLAILRQALGTQQTPSNQILLGLSLFLTVFIMAPVFESAYSAGVEPYLQQQMNAETALQKTLEPVRRFMLDQTRESDLALFLDIANKQVDSVEQVPTSILLPAFVTSELKTAFQIGFLLFLPFLIIDLVVASVLMSMG
ncbi:MAG: flagellar type III secretion system pore protein FliP, partial [Gammaproteobacteria bacterium]|nr:flagellar type III secretion system pore protein FliP [Gammaproteobacteria bacterium]